MIAGLTVREYQLSNLSDFLFDRPRYRAYPDPETCRNTAR